VQGGMAAVALHLLCLRVLSVFAAGGVPFFRGFKPDFVYAGKCFLLLSTELPWYCYGRALASTVMFDSVQGFTRHGRH
jgi:hypothetical protein